ncbi:M48 family metallopeptidase [Actinokineospora sp. HUAS TT18]|uniref:M48 family metallopeptidase n=1 Tax=Actinokineospora sp. HUAS TT18 TaxID=3447451 RepID=UPI003F51C39E
MSEAAATARFRLLHLTLGAAAMFAASYLTVAQDVWRGPNLACVRDTDTPAAFVACTDRLLVWQALVILAAPLLLVLATLCASWTAPWWITRRHRVTARELDDGLRTVLSGLSRQAGLAREPLWCTTPGLVGESFTYGREPRVVLGPQVYRLLRRGQGTAIVRHELGHVVNRDVGRAYRAVLAVGIFGVAFAAPMVFAGPAFGGRFAVLAALGLLTWLAVLRTRETAADRVAAVHDPDGIADALRSAKTRGRLPWWLRTHPSPARRLAALTTSSRLSVVDCVATGVAAAVAAVELGAVLTNLLAGNRLVGTVLAGVLVGAVLAAILGPGKPRSTVGCGVGLAAGILVGTQLSPRGGPALRSVSWSGSGVEPGTALADVPGWTAATLGAALILLCVGIVAWCRGLPGKAAIGVPLGAWFLLLVLAPSAVAEPGPFPRTRQAGYACAWLGASGSAAFDVPGLDAYLRNIDDLWLRRIGASWSADSDTARTALVRRCEFLVRYGKGAR